ncbi:MAG: PQQ-dependent sugar dehydrogenase [Planctomycetes bacterium]|nr:PQQ-dependent sugar dehydrogenase [Planctomycetota bacterium]
MNQLRQLLLLVSLLAIIRGQSFAAQADPAASWTVRQPGFVVETVASGFHLPVNIAFAQSGNQPTDPWFYVSELHGAVKVVRRDGTVQTFAAGLLNFTPFDDSFEGAGEVGLAGIVVEPVSGDLLVSLAYGASGYLHPAVVRLHRSADGLSMTGKTTVLSLSDVTINNSHMASRLSFGPDGKLYLHMGDAANPALSRDRTSFAGKILRINVDGSAPRDNPYYDTTDGISATDYVYTAGLRNPFGGDWREADGQLYVVDNGPSVDRVAKAVRAGDLGYDGTDASMQTGALATWSPAHAPVNLAFIQSTVFGGSGFPVEKQGRAFVSEFGSYWRSGPLTTGKRISEFMFSSTGTVLSGPSPLVEYTGTGKATVVGLAAGADGLYFTDFFADHGSNPTAVGSNVLRVRWTGASGAPTVIFPPKN